MTTRRLAQLLLTVVIACNGSTAVAGESEKGQKRATNVVMILADDLGFGDVGFNGRKEWKTPNIDALAKRGTVLSRFYTAAVVCAPSRGAFLTGKSTIHCGVAQNNADLPSEETTVAEALKAKGYATALFGKWHHGAPRRNGPKDEKTGKTTYVHPMDQGFDEFFGFTDARHAWEKYPKQLWDGRALKDVHEFSDDMCTDRALDFINRMREKPFFLYVSFNSPHFHIQAPPDEVLKHKSTFPGDDPVAALSANYAGLVTRVDRNVGRIVSAIESAGLSDDTLIVFTSDHGATFESGNKGASDDLDSNQPFRGQKRTLWEGGVRVPAVAVWPGHVKPGAVAREPMQMIDLFPTFLAAANVEINPKWHVDGMNLLPVWSGEAHVPERTLFWEWRSEGSHQLAALRDDWKLVVTEHGKPELFHVVRDPAERRNVIANHADIAKALLVELKAWMESEVPYSLDPLAPATKQGP